MNLGPYSTPLEPGEATLTRPGVAGKPIVIRDDDIRHPGATCAVLTAFEDVTSHVSPAATRES
ncbi:hypothetical protein ACBJ59_12635 [Nonomuraea sp. MTCD27]|uniref:hypothetical protein n=1 Tax=Nonomuraea sp. MTCD27 TaxID=1676747 RepID=UPI0035BEDA0D